MSETDKLREQLKKANPSKKWAEQVDNMRPEKVVDVCAEYVQKLRSRAKGN
jgi:hypothetical protein